MTALIGITTSYEDGSQQLDRRYVTAVEDAGGTPVILPTTDVEDTVLPLLEEIDGLLVPGGPAVTEGLRGRLPDDLDRPDPLRLHSDARWIEGCWEAGAPVLGICYGMQLLNALADGTIYGDVEREREDARTHSQKRGATTHEVRLGESSQLRTLLNRESLTVNSRHLQAIDRLGKGFRVTGRAPDGVVEVIEHEKAPLIGVQFHPERMGETMQPLFRALVEQAASPRSIPS